MAEGVKYPTGTDETEPVREAEEETEGASLAEQLAALKDRPRLMSTMYDAVDVATIPRDATIVAGYVDGNWPTYGSLLAAFPNAQHVSITVKGESGAMVADCETGDLTPQSAGHWAANEISQGRRPCIYYSRSIASSVADGLRGAGVGTAEVDYWVADWTGHAHLLPGSVATQYADPTTSGGNFDLSETAPNWPPLHAPPPPPPPTGEFMPPTIKQGDLNGAVRSAQAMLDLHAPLTIDGNFGPATTQAVKNFQTVFRLAVDGIVGPQTWTALCTFG